jgi:hypothetical protein
MEHERGAFKVNRGDAGICGIIRRLSVPRVNAVNLDICFHLHIYCAISRQSMHFFSSMFEQKMPLDAVNFEN